MSSSAVLQYGRTSHPAVRPRIGLDLHVAEGIFQGSRTHCLELFSRVIALTPECDFIVLAASPQKLLSFSENFDLPNVTSVLMPEMSAPARLLWQLPRIARRFTLSLLHTQYIAPPLSFCATTITIHDILFESHPQYFEKMFILRSRLLVPYSARKSIGVFTVSDFSRQQICDTYSIPPAKVHLIPNGVDHRRFFPGNTGCEQLHQFGLKPGDYFLTVGRLEPRKNHVMLLRAWAQINPPRPRLVIVGQRHFLYHEVADLLDSMQLKKDVVLLEQVTDAQLPAIYRNAKGFVYCSWAEGFGMPLIEAMASGVPVISSSNTALSEVCANAALQADPSNPSEISNAVLALDRQPKLRADLIQRGLARAASFTWEQSARTVRDVYLRHFGLCRGNLEPQNVRKA